MTKNELLDIIFSNTDTLECEHAIWDAVEAYSNALLQQTPCYTALEFLEQVLSKEKKIQADPNTGVSQGMITDINVEALRKVISLIRYSYANAV